MNSTLGSVVPLAIFFPDSWLLLFLHHRRHHNHIKTLRSVRTTSTSRQMYDSMSKLVTGQPYPSIWSATSSSLPLASSPPPTSSLSRWEERVACMNFLSPTLEATMENAWSGMQVANVDSGNEIHASWNDFKHQKVDPGKVIRFPQPICSWSWF